MLFNIMINDVAANSKLHSKIFLFADDIAIWIRWKSLALSCKKKLHNDLSNAERVVAWPMEDGVWGVVNGGDGGVVWWRFGGGPK